MKQKLLIAIFLFSAVAYAQAPPFDLKRKEELIRKHLFSQPDSAMKHIREILACKEPLNDTVYAAAHIFYGYSHYLKSDLDSALYSYNKALTYTGTHSASYAWALRNKSMVYRKRGEHDKALALLETAANRYEALGKEQDMAIVYGEMAANYNMMLRSDEAIRYQLKAIEILEKRKDDFFIHTIRQSLANTYMNIGNYEFAIDLYKEVLGAFARINPKNYALTLINYGDCLIYTDKFPQAEKTLLEAVQRLEKFNDAELVAIALTKLAYIEQLKKNPAKAQGYYASAYQKALQANSARLVLVAQGYISLLNEQKQFARALEIIGQVERHPARLRANLKEKMAYEDQKTISYQNSNRDKQALASIQRRLELMDTLTRSANELASVEMQQKFQTKYEAKKNNQLRKANASLKEKLTETQKSRLLPFMALSLLLLTIAMAYFANNRRHRRRLLMAKKDHLALLKEYQDNKKLNETHKKNIGSKQGELVANIGALSTTESHISRLVSLCSETPGQTDMERIKNDLGALLGGKDYRTLFRKQFNEAHAGFQHNLRERFPQLTKNDLFFCSLLKLKLTNKDMALLMQVTPESVVKKKYRVKKRLDLQTETELDTILQNTPDRPQISKNPVF